MSTLMMIKGVAAVGYDVRLRVGQSIHKAVNRGGNNAADIANSSGAILSPISSISVCPRTDLAFLEVQTDEEADMYVVPSMLSYYVGLDIVTIKDFNLGSRILDEATFCANMTRVFGESQKDAEAYFKMVYSGVAATAAPKRPAARSSHSWKPIANLLQAAPLAPKDSTQWGAEAGIGSCTLCPNWSGFTGRCSETGLERGAKDTCCKGDV